MRPPEATTRVGYVLKMYPRLAETFILNELLAHEAAGLDLDVISLRAPIDGRFHHDLARVKAGVTYLPGQSVKADVFWSSVCRARREMPGGERILDFAEHETATDVYQAILLADLVRERRIDHLHAHFATIATTVARMASHLAQVPFSFTAHAKDIFHETVVDDDLRRKLRDAAAAVTVSEFNVAYLEERYGADAARVHRVYNGLDLAAFPYTAPRDRPMLVLGVGRLVDKKGFSDLIDACVILAERGRNFTCEIVGDGVLRSKLEAQVENLGIGDRVELLGARSRDDVVERMKRAAVVAVPCVISPNGNRDGLPTVLLEAMALGTPCISTDVTGIPEVLRDGETGLLCEQNDPSSLCDALDRMLEDEPLRIGLAANARRMIEADFDIHRNTPALREIFRSGAAREAKVALEVG